MRTVMLVVVAVGVILTGRLGVVGAQGGTAAETSRPATDVTAEQIHAVVNQEIADGKPVDDRSIRVVDAGGHNVGIGVVYRVGPGTAGRSASHDKVTEVYYMIEGAGILVTGGTHVNPERRAGTSIVVSGINGPGISGDAIHGGVSRRIKAGDMVIIPAGTPHLWSTVEGKSMTYVVVRLDPSQVVALK
jgi:mannose-6-phosphate isomerase-like protein (cupin superfamily)